MRLAGCPRFVPEEAYKILGDIARINSMSKGCCDVVEIRISQNLASIFADCFADNDICMVVGVENVRAALLGGIPCVVDKIIEEGYRLVVSFKI